MEDEQDVVEKSCPMDPLEEFKLQMMDMEKMMNGFFFFKFDIIH